MALPDFPIDIPRDQQQIEGDQKYGNDGLYGTHHRNISIKGGVDKGKQRSLKTKGFGRYREGEVPWEPTVIV